MRSSGRLTKSPPASPGVAYDHLEIIFYYQLIVTPSHHARRLRCVFHQARYIDGASFVYEEIRTS